MLGVRLLSKMKIFVLGASSDIGIEVCKKFISQGWDVVAQYRTPNEKINALITGCNANIKLLKLDLMDLVNNEKILDIYDDLILTADSFVNCAGAYNPLNFEKISAINLIEHFQLNVIPSILIEKKLIPQMISNKFGRILNISSVGIKYGGGSQSFGYSLSKHAVEFMPGEFKKWAKDNVFINTLRVGVTNTKFHKLDPNKNIRKRIELIPVNRMAEPDEIAKMIWNLASTENTYITGQTITISGGE